MNENVADSAGIDTATGYAFIELWANSVDLLGDEYFAPDGQPAPVPTTMTTAANPVPTTTLVTTQTTMTTKTLSTSTTKQTTATSTLTDYLIQWAADASTGQALQCSVSTGASLTASVTYDTVGVHVSATIVADASYFAPGDDGGALYTGDNIELIFDITKSAATLTAGVFKVVLNRAGKVT